MIKKNRLLLFLFIILFGFSFVYADVTLIAGPVGEIQVKSEPSTSTTGVLTDQINSLEEAIKSLETFFDNFQCSNDQKLVEKKLCNSDESDLIEINDKICCPENDVKLECDKSGMKHGFVYESVMENNCKPGNILNLEKFKIYVEDGNVCCNTTQKLDEIDGMYYSYNVISSTILTIESLTDSIYVDIYFYEITNDESAIKIFNFTNNGCIYQINKTDSSFTNFSNCDNKDSLFYKVMNKEYSEIIKEVETKTNFMYRNLISKNSDILRAIADMDRLEKDFLNKIEKNNELNMSNKTQVTEDLTRIYNKFIDTSGFDLIKTCFTKYNIEMEGYVNFVMKNSNSFSSRNYLNVNYDKEINKDTYCLTVKNDLKRRLINYYGLKSSAQRFLEGWTNFFDLQDNIDKMCEECGNDRTGMCIICPTPQTSADFGKQVLNSLLLPAVVLVPIVKIYRETYDDFWEGFKGTISDLEDFTKASLPIEADFGLFLEITNLNDVWDLSEFNSGVTSSNECWSISWTNIFDIKKFISSLGTSFTCQIKHWADLDEDDDPLTFLLKLIDTGLNKMKIETNFFENSGKFLKEIGNVDEFVKNTCEKMKKEGYTMEEVFDLNVEKRNPDGQSIYLNFLSAYNFSVMDYSGLKNHYYLMFKIFLPLNFTPNLAEKNCYIGNFYRKENSDNFNNLRIVSDQSNLIFFDDFNNKYSISLGSYASQYDIISKKDGFCFKNTSGSEYCYPKDLTYDYKDSKMVFKKNDFEIKLSSSYNIEKQHFNDNNLICIKNEINNFFTFLGPDQLPQKSDENTDENHEDNLKMIFIFYNSTGSYEVLSPVGINYRSTARQGNVLNMYPTFFNMSKIDNAFHFTSEKYFKRVCAWFNYDLELLNNGIFKSTEMSKDTLMSNGGTDYPYCMDIQSSPVDGSNLNDGSLADTLSDDENDEDDEDDEDDENNDDNPSSTGSVSCFDNPSACY